MKIFTADAFTDRPFSGNPAGVCILDSKIPEEMYRLIAREINHSETAFVTADNGRYRIRWFTPKSKWNFAGMQHLPPPMSFTAKDTTIIRNR